MQAYLGVDVGSVSTNLVVINEDGKVLVDIYLRTAGQPIKVVQEGMRQVAEAVKDKNRDLWWARREVLRTLTGVIVGADTVKNEITAHAVAASHLGPMCRQFWKLAGRIQNYFAPRRGSRRFCHEHSMCCRNRFLSGSSSARLNIPIEEFGALALQSTNPVRIAGRCSVFAESDMIHKQQMGHLTPDIVAGLCDALVRNYLNNVGKGKEILPR